MQPDAEGYEIKNAKTPILLAIARIEELKPHEEIIDAHLRTIVNLLTKDPILHHPVITDKETGLVLDGTHRLEAIKKLHCKLAPCAMVDYKNSKIRIDRWFRTIEHTTLDAFKVLAKNLMSKYGDPTTARNCLAKRTCYAAIEDGTSSLTFSTSVDDPVRLTQAAFEIERIARTAKLKVGLVDKNGLRPPDGLILSTITLRKREVLEAVKNGRKFTPKTTRHIIPSRPLGIGIPLEWLRGRSLPRTQTKFARLLQHMEVVRKPPGSRFGSRQYEEEIFIFERDSS